MHLLDAGTAATVDDAEIGGACEEQPSALGRRRTDGGVYLALDPLLAKIGYVGSDRPTMTAESPHLRIRWTRWCVSAF